MQVLLRTDWYSTSSPSTDPRANMLLSTLLLHSIFVIALAIKDYGIPNWRCDNQVMRRSAIVPKSVHSLRFADIDVIGAIGDSLTAGNGAGALNDNDTNALRVQYRGLVFSVGGESNLDHHVSLANILKKFNPNLFGFSLESGSANDARSAQFNAAVPGAKAVNLTSQARDLVQRITNSPQVNIANDWKLIHVFIGGNDVCAWCDNPQDETAELFGQRITEAIQVLKNNLPRTIVVITGMMDITVLKELGEKNYRCKIMHGLVISKISLTLLTSFRGLCPCVQNEKFTTEQLRGVCKDYMRKQDELQFSGLFDSSDDFTVVVQPFFENNSRAPLLSNGQLDLSLFAPDCFHFSAYGHAVVGKSLWNNLLQPLLAKSTTADLTNLTSPLYCPNPSCPFIRTTKNTMDCRRYMTPASLWG